MNINNSLKKIVRGREIEKKRRIKSIIVLLSVFFIGIFIGNFFVQDNLTLTGLVTGNLPDVGDSNWGTILNSYLLQEHTENGSHKNVTVTGDLNVSGNVNITGDTNLTGNLTVNEDAKFENNVNISGNVTILGNISSGTPDANTLYAKSLPKAWVNFNGTSTSCVTNAGSCTNGCVIRDSFNVECVNRSAIGDYTIFWDRDFANANYIVITTLKGDSTSNDNIINEDFSTPRTKGNITYRVRDVSAVQDSANVNAIAFGEQ